MFSPMIWYNFYLIVIVFRWKFYQLFIFSLYVVMWVYVFIYIYMHIYMWDFFHCLQIAWVFLFSYAFLRHFAWKCWIKSLLSFLFLPSWLFPAVLFIFVKFSFMPSICLICRLVLFLLLFSLPCRATDGLLFAWFSFLMHIQTTGVCSFESYICLPDLALYYYEDICHLGSSERLPSWDSLCLPFLLLCSFLMFILQVVS